jgi:hypothetical protein
MILRKKRLDIFIEQIPIGSLVAPFIDNDMHALGGSDSIHIHQDHPAKPKIELVLI